MARRTNLTPVKDSALLLAEKRDEQAHLAYEMRREGKSWYAIGKALGITESSARNGVSRAMTEAAAYVSTGSKQELLTMECERLDAMQAAIWGPAMAGSTRAIESILRIIQTRAKLLGLDSIPDTTITNNTLVVTGSSEEYVAALRAIAGGNQ